MREVVLDTETTGLTNEDRVLEIGCIELVDLLPTGRELHLYVNPQKASHPAALKVHGLTPEFLKKYPTFKAQGPRFLDFIGDAPLIAHNAPFDIRMLNNDLERVGLPRLTNPVIDTQELDKEVRPGKKHSLDAICGHFKIDRAERAKFHGALVDARILAEVYLQLRGGRQRGMDLVVVEEKKAEYVKPDYGPRVFKSRITQEEYDRWVAFMQSALKGPTIWDEHINPKEEKDAA